VRIAVWGAGEIGTQLAYRLTSSAHVSEIHWINGRSDKIGTRVVDIQHGLAFAPTCHWVKKYALQRASKALAQSDLVVLAVGGKVPKGGSRLDLLEQNKEVLNQAVVPLLTGYPGIVLVVTNPVDALTLHVQKSAAISAARCIGLGTVVETARVRAALAKHMTPLRPPREVLAYAIGTHDEHVVVVTTGATALAGKPWPDAIVEMARKETVLAAARVKEDGRSTLHPVVEGTISVLEAIAADRRAVLTVSTLDSERRICYSLPCTLGRDGVVHRHLDVLSDPQVEASLEACISRLQPAQSV